MLAVRRAHVRRGRKDDRDRALAARAVRVTGATQTHEVSQPAAQAASNAIASLLAEVAAAPSVERAHEKTEELVRTLVGFYGDGLEKILTIVHDAGAERAPAIFEALCADEFVESLLVLHGLHPLSLEERVEAALESVRPYLASHEGAVDLVGIEGDVAEVRFRGSCDGCPSSSATMQGAVERAILERVPEITTVRAAGVAPAASSSLRVESDWVALDALPTLPTDGLARLALDGTTVLFVRGEAALYAYRDRCPACASSFGDAHLEWPFVRCGACGGRFDVVRAGRSENDARTFAEPFPLVREGERVRVAIPLGV